MQNISQNKYDSPLLFIVIFFTILGGAMRLMVPLFSSVPLNDGGLFYIMIGDLQENNFLLPAYTTYNASQIPFAYPPLGFYIAGAFANVFKISVIDVIRILPAVISTLTIPAFFLFAYDVLKSKPQTAIAVMIFAFLPRTFDWHIMGGGITRAPGFLFAILSIHSLYNLYSIKNRKYVFRSVLFFSLTVITHPEAAVQVIVSALIFYLFLDRSFLGFMHSVWVGLGAGLLSSPWWGSVIAEHSLSTILAPLQTTQQDGSGFFSRIFILIGFKFTDELFLSIISILSLIGIAVVLSRREYLLVIWLSAMFLIEPRGGTLYLMLPHAMLAGIAVEGLILPGIVGVRHSHSKGKNWAEELLHNKTTKIILGYIFIYSIMSAFIVAGTISNRFTLKAFDTEAFDWVKENTAAESQFILITREVPLRDSTSEWFPALTNRKSIATVFGYEWVNDGSFNKQIEAYNSLQRCASDGETCLSNWVHDTGNSYDYVYIRKFVENTFTPPVIMINLKNSENHELVYDSEGVVIFKIK